MSWRRAGIVALLVAAVALGAGREFLFLNLNYQLDFVQYGRPVSYAHSLFQGWVQGWDLPALLALKWALAAWLVALMAALCVLLAWLLWGDQRYRGLLLMAYAGAAVATLALHALGALAPALGEVSVQLLHALQYPVVLFVLVLARLLGGTPVR